MIVGRWCVQLFSFTVSVHSVPVLSFRVDTHGTAVTAL